MRLTPPTQNIFYLSIVLAIVALIVYVLGLATVLPLPLSFHLAFWLVAVAWAAITAGVAFKGV